MFLNSGEFLNLLRNCQYFKKPLQNTTQVILVHATEAYVENKDTALLILNLCTRLRLVVNVTRRSLDHREIIPVFTKQQAGLALELAWTSWRRAKPFASPGLFITLLKLTSCFSRGGAVG